MQKLDYISKNIHQKYSPMSRIEELQNMVMNFEKYDSVEVCFKTRSGDFFSERGFYVGKFFDMFILKKKSYYDESSITIDGIIKIMPCRIVLCEKYRKHKEITWHD